jgi:2-polyprenyl-6-methoxyphenol hydroxylase-like FAD-dependent oxidoreductase
MDGESHIPIVRATLREVLEDVVNFGKEFTHYEQAPNGKVTASITDGTSAVGDVLVGADGTGSNIRKRYLPAPRRCGHCRRHMPNPDRPR